jgi:hypothetical protein
MKNKKPPGSLFSFAVCVPLEDLLQIAFYVFDISGITEPAKEA